ncbi:kinase-like domain-containing protein [Cladorrhinum sp. PSN332]|nr:kinase-like domain-containing protein [Cladorrhinum sp. PSN332]
MANRGDLPGYSRLEIGYPTSDYVFWKNLDGRISLYKRKTDGEIFIGRYSTLHDNQFETGIWNLYEAGAGAPAANVLNHENIVSIHTEVVHQQWEPDAGDQEDADPEHIILYDYCDAGSLETLLNKSPVKLSLRGPFLPESLCWHVALSLLRALQWLHEGIRDTYNAVEDRSSRRPWTTVTRCHRIRTKTAPQLGWFPILHRDIKPSNVLFSHPKGIETYGTVKLSGMASCLVTGGMLHGPGLGPEDAPAVGYDKVQDPPDEETPAPPIWDLVNWYGNWKKLGKDQPADKRPYTTGNDLWDVGAVLYQMMFGLPPPAPEECRGGGCSSWHWYRRSEEVQTTPHVQSNSRCVGDHDLESFADHLNYSTELKNLLKALMAMNRKITPLASTLLDQAWTGYQLWASGTDAGRLYRDVYDDIWFRRNNEWRMVRKQHATLGVPPDQENQNQGGQGVDMIVL